MSETNVRRGRPGKGRRQPRPISAGSALLGLLLLPGIGGCSAAAADAAGEGGQLILTDGATIGFEEILSLTVRLGSPDESPTPSEVDEWVATYSPTTDSRFIPLDWVRSIEVESYEVDPGCSCLRDAVLSVRTVNGVEFSTRRVAMVESVRVRTADGVRTADDQAGADGVVEVPFVVGDRLHVRRLVVRD